MNYLLAVSPLLIFIFFLLVFRIRIQYVAALTFLYTVLLAKWKWSLPLHSLGAATGKGLFLTLDILLILFGAIIFLNYLKKVGVISRLELLLSSLSPDRRIQAILLAWFFGSFIEGTSGFGTPALVVAPLMVGIGFRPIMAILICLTANSTAVAFGAVGTPIRIGFAGLNIAGVSENAAFINLIAGVFVPLFIVAFVVGAEPKPRAKAFFECVPWALFSAMAFLVPYYLFSLISFEFPSIFGSAIGLTIAVTSIRFNFLIPKSTFRFSAEASSYSESKTQNIFGALGPYALLLILLLSGKFFLSDWKISFELGQNLTHSVQLFNPGLAFLTVVALLNISKDLKFQELSEIATTSLALIGKTAVSIFCVAALTYTMVITGAEDSTGMLQMIAEPLANQALPFFSVFIGALGSFLAGSATVSNLLFGQIQVQAAEQLEYSVSWILALQLVGAGIGNMIALPNLLAAQAAVGINDQESNLLRSLAMPCLIYLIMAATVGLRLLYYNS